MNTLKTLSSLLKTNSSCLISSGGRELKMHKVWFTKRVTNYSTAEFIRNKGVSALTATIYNTKTDFKQQSFLLPQLQSGGYAPIYNTYCKFSTKNAPDRANKSDTKSAAVTEANLFGEASNLGLFARFKLMYKKYWYVLIPVHVVTSAGWICGFYYLSKSGVDVASLLQYLPISEAIIEKVKLSNVGHWAVAYLCYKIATPLRYAVTLGGTTVSIKYLVQQGHIKPIPSRQELVRMYEEKKAHRAAFKAEKDQQELQRQQQQDQQNK